MKSDTSIWLLRSVSWRRWKRGLCVAVLTGALTGVVAVSLGVEMTLKQAVALLALSIAKDCLLFLKQYPVQHTTDTTHFIYKHLRLFGWLALAALAAGCISKVIAIASPTAALKCALTARITTLRTIILECRKKRATLTYRTFSRRGSD